MTIRNEDTPIGHSGHFKMSEFYSKSVDAPTEHYLDERLIEFAEAVRHEYGATRINSTFRTKLGNFAFGGAKSSQHLLGKAIDLAPVDREQLARFIKDIREGGPILQELASLGMTGLGTYDNFVHLDCRDGNVAVWDHTGKSPVEKIREFILGREEPGDSGAELRMAIEGVSGFPAEYVPYGVGALLVYFIWKRIR